MNPWTELLSLFPEQKTYIGIISNYDINTGLWDVDLVGGGSITAIGPADYSNGDYVIVENGRITEKIPITYEITTSTLF